MNLQSDQTKGIRILNLYERLQKGELINKQEESERFNVDPRTIQRDIELIREYSSQTNHFENTGSISYNRKEKGYVIEKDMNIWLTFQEILTLAKILLESRAFNQEELNTLLTKLFNQLSSKYKKQFQDVILNEKFHYKPLQHDKPIINAIGEFSSAIRTKNIVEIEYSLEQAKTKKRHIIKPVGLLFSEFYFYVAAYIEGSHFSFPTIFRLDRITSYNIKKVHFKIPEIERFQEGELRKHIQFMSAGKLMDIQFKFWGASLTAVLDRIPTAEIIKKEADYVIIRAKVFGKGIKMWLLSQAQNVEVLSPIELRNEMRETIKEMMSIYES
ncbi:YafY family protein [Bacillus sp. S/N-304-OC-R1]|uniref:helix-turn-helix transcriptional regulator n=1 Tax=Bacillus sp. S/N-304-OC-R1 TaxID=2758034 RepID=UPI001C8E76F5|nr:WYL domain-containing protein [Bacillus sp. S/N-304-OC-R1]MBY0124394.1 WYL domain-containing protein [Bacillus sp. S/N-304-OC-R1]